MRVFHLTILAMIFLSTQSALAGSSRFMSCKVANGHPWGLVPDIENLLFTGEMGLNCSNRSSKHYIKIKSKGLLSLRVGPEGKFGIMCTNSNPKGAYYGLKLGTYLFFGGDTLLMAGKKGVCSISGVSGGIQFGVDVSLLSAEIY